ncbi:3-methyl-2-oxobutanoatehydroxymethyltransferase [Thermovirga lienii DSM 17291]|uniref:3-methyl-2-oxobutanoate hydroxymethyltransferase n=1 Tax=Thermovirga lienii (strain ATCC BAA-1197 / DSM 17291 / Cas60314) TaxID=580340 RepID=G7V5R4_THELD|nr:3-methyl-2-oxobutanoate hydroxymethyltransferase [Thermovirga lienii]AER66974.1 3-methyl-2-oxobutanoatehydroxymethyltransferase [Thermovirga lienii DSM 17291]
MGKVLSIPDFMRMKQEKEPIVMVTAYNHWQARLAEKAGADMILVGDSVGMVEHGLKDTLGVTMEMMLMHCKAVMRARQRAFVVGDLPFLSYEVDEREAIRNAGLLVKEAGVDAVKLEGGKNRVSTIRAIVDAGIAVVGHIGLTPQTATLLGGYRVQGKDEQSARRVLEDAIAVQEAGACAVVLECVPASLAEFITQKLSIPTIGIGAGSSCDGQVLVFHDILGLFETFKPKFVKSYANGAEYLGSGLEGYVREVKNKAFPTQEHSFAMDEKVMEALKKESI